MQYLTPPEKIASRTVADEYFAVTDKVDALYGQPPVLPADAIGPGMARLRREHHRLLGNGYCTRPPELDCAFESICETCTFFQTSIEFRPTLQAQRRPQPGRPAAAIRAAPQPARSGRIMNHDSEYRYTPAPGTGPCAEHPDCIIIRCHRFLCPRPVHQPLRQPGQPRRFCSPACRVAEHRRLRG